ncbi:MAG: hypothetical protein KDC35_00485 [Acidobacteria bacterium]|nr:hypothetical protein [Acidobacteriota bacterium]
MTDGAREQARINWLTLLPMTLYTASIGFAAQEAGSPKLGILLQSHASEIVLQACLSQSVPTLIASRPGPIHLARGLRVLPNHVLPDAPYPQFLVISGFESLTTLELAYVRACLVRGSQVIWIGPSFPDSFASMPLKPGQEIRRLDVEQLADYLKGISQNASEHPD